MPSDTYTLIISDAGVSIPSSHGSTHLTGGSDAIPVATTTTSGLMSAAMVTDLNANNLKVSNITHTGDVVDTAGSLKVTGINSVNLADLPTGILKVTTGTGAVGVAGSGDFPTLNQNTTGRAAVATLADTATLALTANTASSANTANTATSATTAGSANNLSNGALGSIPYQSGIGETSFLPATPTAGKVLTSNGQAAPSWQDVTLTSTLPVSKGGTGATSLTGVLVGNGTSSFTTKTAPSGALVGTTDIQTLSNKTLASDVQFAEPLSVQYGGTGTNTFAAGILRANGTSDFITVTQPSGDLVGTTASQTLTNKILGSGTSFLNPLTVSNGGTGVTTSTGSGANVLSNSPSLVTPALGTPSSGNLSNCTNVSLTTGVAGTLPVSNGGTGTTTFDAGYIKSNGTTLTSVATIPIANGGTGVTSFSSGYVKSDGTVLTTSATIPATDITGLAAGAKEVMDLTTDVTGILPAANGGTGVSGPCRGGIYSNDSFPVAAATGAYVPVSGDGSVTLYSSPITTSGVTSEGNSKIQFSTGSPRVVFVSVTGICYLDALVMTDFAFFDVAIGFNGVVQDASKVRIYRPAGGDATVNISCQAIVLSTGTDDYFEIYSKLHDGTADNEFITFNGFNVIFNALV